MVCLVVRLWVPPLSLGPLGSCYSSVKGFFDLFSVDHRCRLRSPRPRRGTLLLPRGRNRLLAAGGIETALFVHPSDDTLVHGQRAPTTEGRRQLGQRRRWPQIARLTTRCFCGLASLNRGRPRAVSTIGRGRRSERPRSHERNIERGVMSASSC